MNLRLFQKLTPKHPKCLFSTIHDLRKIIINYYLEEYFGIHMYTNKSCRFWVGDSIHIVRFTNVMTDNSFINLEREIFKIPPKFDYKQNSIILLEWIWNKVLFMWWFFEIFVFFNLYLHFYKSSFELELVDAILAWSITWHTSTFVILENYMYSSETKSNH